MQNGTKIVVAAIAGALAGAVTGLLMAPTSGKETRGKISEKTDEVLDYLNEMAQKIKKQKEAAKEEE